MNNLLLNLLLNILALSIGVRLVNAFIPMPMVIKSLLNLLVMLVLIIFILQYAGIMNNIVPMYRIV